MEHLPSFNGPKITTFSVLLSSVQYNSINNYAWNPIKMFSKILVILNSLTPSNSNVYLNVQRCHSDAFQWVAKNTRCSIELKRENLMEGEYLDRWHRTFYEGKFSKRKLLKRVTLYFQNEQATSFILANTNSATWRWGNLYPIL